MDLGLKIQKTNVGIRMIIHEILCVQFSGKMDNFHFFGPNLPKNGFWDQNFKNLTVDLESAPLKYQVCQFSGKTDKPEFFHLTFGKLPNYMRYFGSNNVEGIAENSVEAEMSWLEVGQWFSKTLT